MPEFCRKIQLKNTVETLINERFVSVSGLYGASASAYAGKTRLGPSFFKVANVLLNHTKLTN